jgi:hypothetical protein
MKGVGPGHKNIPRPTNFYVEVSKGRVPGHSMIHKFGHGSIGTTTTPICNSGVYQTPLAEVALEVLSDDAGDTLTGLGARTVFVEGLAFDGSIVTQTIPLNGLVAVPIPIPLWRLYRWWVLTSGTYATTSLGSHIGALTIQGLGGGDVWSIIDLDPHPHGQSEIGWYTIPKGFTGSLITMAIVIDSTKSADIMFLHRENANIVTAPFSPMRLVIQAVGATGLMQTVAKSPKNDFHEFADLGAVAKVSSGTAKIATNFELLLIEDGY